MLSWLELACWKTTHEALTLLLLFGVVSWIVSYMRPKGD
jgi:hypothetical protein